MNKPIPFKKSLPWYKCPDCNEENPSEDAIRNHIYKCHTWPGLEKEVKLLGTNCEFTSEEQAKQFADAYAGHRSDWDNDYESEVKWEGPGKYYFTTGMTRDFHHQSDLGRTYKITFRRFGFQ